MPYATAHEELWRGDHLYDIVIETSHNKRPRIQGRGSAIFFHLARPDYGADCRLHCPVAKGYAQSPGLLFAKTPVW